MFPFSRRVRHLGMHKRSFTGRFLLFILVLWITSVKKKIENIIKANADTRMLPHTYTQTSHTVYFLTQIACHQCAAKHDESWGFKDVWLEMLQNCIGGTDTTSKLFF